MSIKAAYNGPSGTGVDVPIIYEDGVVVTVHVEHGHQLPTEVEGPGGESRTVPASVRDSLLEQEGWDPVRISDTTKKEKE